MEESNKINENPNNMEFIVENINRDLSEINNKLDNIKKNIDKVEFIEKYGEKYIRLYELDNNPDELKYYKNIKTNRWTPKISQLYDLFQLTFDFSREFGYDKEILYNIRNMVYVKFMYIIHTAIPDAANIKGYDYESLTKMMTFISKKDVIGTILLDNCWYIYKKDENTLYMTSEFADKVLEYVKEGYKISGVDIIRELIRSINRPVYKKFLDDVIKYYADNNNYQEIINIIGLIIEYLNFSNCDLSNQLLDFIKEVVEKYDIKGDKINKLGFDSYSDLHNLLTAFIVYCGSDLMTLDNIKWFFDIYQNDEILLSTKILCNFRCHSDDCSVESNILAYIMDEYPEKKDVIRFLLEKFNYI